MKVYTTISQLALFCFSGIILPAASKIPGVHILQGWNLEAGTPCGHQMTEAQAAALMWG